MGVDAANTPQFSPPQPVIGEIGDHDLRLVTDDYMGDGAASLDQYADLTANLAGDSGQMGGEFSGDQLCGGDAAAIDPLQRINLAFF